MAEVIDRSLKMAAVALEKEERGRDFYIKAASTCVNEPAKEIFRMLTKEEVAHIGRVKAIYEALKGGNAWSADWKAHKTEDEDLQKLFRDRILKQGAKITSGTDDIQALEIGMEFEQGAIDFYEDALKKADDPLEREFIELMIREERSHFAALSDIKQYLTDPDAWHTEMERHGMDGA
jgi:rubrerythrin